MESNLTKRSSNEESQRKDEHPADEYGGYTEAGNASSLVQRIEKVV